MVTTANWAGECDGIEMMLDGTARMAYAGDVPWHKKGQGFTEPMLSEQAMTAAHLAGWDVKTGPIYTPEGIIIPGYERIYRPEDGTVFGVSRGQFKPIQIERQFDFMDSLVMDGVIRYEAAFSLMNGKRIALLARLNETMRILDDQYYPFVLSLGSFEPGHAVQTFPSTVRGICRNTVRMALSKDGSKGVRISHTGDIEGKLEAAAKLLRVTTQQERNYGAWLESLASHKMPEREVKTVQDALFGSLDGETSGRKLAAIERFREIYNQEEERNGANGYTTYQAITGYGNFGRSLRTKRNGEDSRFMSLFEGASGEFIERGTLALAEISGVQPVAV